MSLEDRAAEIIELLVQDALTRITLSPLGIYGATVVNTHTNGKVDVLCDEERISYVNDCDVYPGIPGLQVTPVAQSLISPGARCLLLWRGGNKQYKTVMGFGSSPTNSARALELQVREKVLVKVPDYVIDGTLTCNRLLSGGRPSVGAIIGIALGGDDAQIISQSGTDMAFKLTVKACTNLMPPPTVGQIALVPFANGPYPGEVFPMVMPDKDALGLKITVQPIGSLGLSINCDSPPTPALQFSVVVHTIGTAAA